MCIIIAKDKKGRLPKEEELKRAFEWNNDGAGFMYVDNGKVVIEKGYMKYNAFIKKYKSLLAKYNNFNNKSLVIHCRIGTSGRNTKGNTHPYPITNNVKLLKSKHLTQDIGIVHNGIIRGFGTEKGLNDTQEFIINYIYPIYSHWKDFYKNEYIMNGIEEITGSKFVILDKNDNLYYIGDFIEEEGLYFSNNTYQEYKYYSYKYNDCYDWYDNLKSLQDKIEYKGGDYKEEDCYFPLEPDYFIDLWGNGNVEKVGNRDYWFDFETLELYEYKDDEFRFVATNPIIYDERYQEIW